jgi:hypothetical protein
MSILSSSRLQCPARHEPSYAAAVGSKVTSQFRWLILAALAVLLLGEFSSRSGNHTLAGTLSLVATALFAVALVISLRSRYRKASGAEGSTIGPVQDPSSSWQEFLADLRLAGGAWRTNPWLPVVTIAVSVVGAVGYSNQADSVVSVASLLFAFLSAGFYGTQRVWYLRVFRGLSISPSEVWSFSWSFLGRYLILGLLITVALVPLFLANFLTSGRRSAFGGFWYVGIVVSVVFDLLLTFVTSELAFRTRSATQALDAGIRMIRRTWPAAAYYVFVPPLAIQVLVYQLAGIGGTSLVGIGAAAAVAALISLLFKGAIAAFYLRQVPGISDDGAVHLVHPTTSRSAPLAETESAT